MRITTDQGTIKRLQEKEEHDVRADGQGIFAGVKFKDFIDKTTDKRYRVHEGEKEVPVQRSLVPVVG